jgi:hypothetical protein
VAVKVLGIGHFIASATFDDVVLVNTASSVAQLALDFYIMHNGISFRLEHDATFAIAPWTLVHMAPDLSRSC